MSTRASMAARGRDTGTGLPRTNDAVWMALIALIGGVATWVAFRMIGPAIVHASTFDYWFESDAPAITRQLSERMAVENERANRHPLFTLILYPLVSALRALPRMDTVAAVGLTYSALAALWSALFFLLLRRLGLQRIEAFIFTVLALATSSAVFWLPVPETVAPAALTTLVALVALAWHENTGRLSWAGCVLVSAVTLSMTVTNAVAGFLVCIVVLGWKRGSTAIASSLALVAAGQLLERLLFPHTAAFFLPGGEIETSAYTFSPLAGSVGDRLAGFFLHSLMVPPLQQGYTGYLSVQQAGLSSAPAPVLVGWGLWVALLAAGIAGLRCSRRLKFAVVLLAVLASQLALVLVFGLETFLYVLQSGPLLVALAALGCLTRFRRWVLGGAVVLILLAVMENGQRFTAAAELLRHRYEGARAYAEAIGRFTTSSDLIVVGLPPAAAYGWIAPPVRTPTERLSLLPRFGSVPGPRRGWHLHYERWSNDALDQLRRAGARYFASNYAWGIRNSGTLRTYLDENGRLLERAPDWVIYSLRPPAATVAVR